MRSILIAALSAMLLAACATHNNDFNIKAATQKVGSLMASDTNEFFLLNIPPDTNSTQASVMLAENLKKAALIKASVAVVGADYNLNYSVLKQSLLILSRANLSGAEILFLGNQQNFNELEQLSSSVGAKFKATNYP